MQSLGRLRLSVDVANGVVLRMAIAIFPLVVAIIGALIYALTSTAPMPSSKAAMLGLIAYAVGLLWLVHGFASRMVHF